jgi:hypothetical protein
MTVVIVTPLWAASLTAIHHQLPSTQNHDQAVARAIVVPVTGSYFLPEPPRRSLPRTVASGSSARARAANSDLRVNASDLDQKMLKAALDQFYKLREKDGLRKKPTTSELIDWLLVLLRGGLSAEDLGREVPFLGVLLKKEQDVELVKQGGRFRHN